jgi:putative transposase
VTVHRREIDRPLGDDGFLSGLERLTGRALKPGKLGPKSSGQEAPLAKT